MSEQSKALKRFAWVLTGFVLLLFGARSRKSVLGDGQVKFQRNRIVT